MGKSRGKPLEFIDGPWDLFLLMIFMIFAGSFMIPVLAGVWIWEGIRRSVRRVVQK